MAKVQIPPPSTVVLELSADEAQALVQVTWRVGGSRARSRRLHIEEIQRVLREAGFKPGDDDCIGGSIMFTENESQGAVS